MPSESSLTSPSGSSSQSRPSTKKKTQSLKSRTRKDYKFFLSYRTRWNDNDQYAHLNNAIYYFLFDTIVNTYLITHCSLSPTKSPTVAFVISSNCTYFSALSFPTVIDLGLRVNKLGKSSVQYEIGVFEQGKEGVAAVGGFVHVFVDRGNGRPVGEIDVGYREKLGKLVVDGKREKRPSEMAKL